MGMTIDDAIKIFNTLLAFHNVTCTIDELEEVCKMAIDTMRKYQKIERYMEKLEKNGQYGTLRKLKIVLGEAE